MEAVESEGGTPREAGSTEEEGLSASEPSALAASCGGKGKGEHRGR